MSDVFIRVVIGFLAGWFIGFMMTRTALKNRYEDDSDNEPMGYLKVVYDRDNPSQPVMGLEIESLDYILNNDEILLKIDKRGFPSTKGPVYLRSHKDDKSA